MGRIVDCKSVRKDDKERLEVAEQGTKRKDRNELEEAEVVKERRAEEVKREKVKNRQVE